MVLTASQKIAKGFLRKIQYLEIFFEMTATAIFELCNRSSD
jgi:hypothetical protein